MSSLVFTWFPLVFAQILRGLCIIVGPTCIILSGRLARTPGMNLGQKCRFAGLSLLLLSTTYTSIERWTKPTTLQLFINLIGVAFSLIGLRCMFVEQGRRNHA